MIPLCDLIKTDLDGIKFPCLPCKLARVLNVGSDTVVRWAKQVRAETLRTPSGHCRITRAGAEKIMSHLRHGN